MAVFGSEGDEPHCGDGGGRGGGRVGEHEPVVAEGVGEVELVGGGAVLFVDEDGGADEEGGVEEGGGGGRGGGRGDGDGEDGGAGGWEEGGCEGGDWG